MAYRTYELTFTGRAGSTARAEFEDCEVIVGPQSTTLRATLPDQSALAGLIERLLALHCELLRVAVLPPPPGQPVPGQPVPGQPVPGQPVPGQPVPGQPVPGQPVPGRGYLPLVAVDAGTQVVFDTVNRLFSVGLTLTNALGLIGPGAGADRVAAAIGELDDTIRDIRAAAFGHLTAETRASAG